MTKKQTKKCNECLKIKHLTNFHKSKRRPDGLEPKCKPCRKDLAARYYKESWFRKTFILKRALCKKNRIPFDLTPEYLESIWTDYCPIRKVKFVKHDKTHSDSPTLDRVNPILGYVKGNVCYISARANRIKYDATAEELRQILGWLEGATTISKESTLK